MSNKPALIFAMFLSACSFNAAGLPADGTDAAAASDASGTTDAALDAAPKADAGPCGDAAPEVDAAPSVPTITCKVVSTGIEYTITGGILDHLWSPSGTGTVAMPTFLEYGDDYDGWVLPYSDGVMKQKVAYTGENGTYVFTMAPVIDDLNFFLTDPSDTDASDGAVGGKYFDLTEWTFVNVANTDGVVPNCRLDAGGGGILH